MVLGEARFLRVSEAISSCELGVISCVRARFDLVRVNGGDGKAFRFSGATLRRVGRPLYLRRDLSNYCYVDVRAVWRHVSCVVSGIWADTLSDAWPHVGRHGSSEKERSPVRVVG